MKNDLYHIKNLCEKYLTEPKLIVVPSFSVKGQLQKTILDENIPFLNLNMKTVEELALDIVSSNLIDTKYTIIDNAGMEDVIYEVLSSMKENSELEYFQNIEITSGLVGLIARTILEVKKAGYYFNNINLELINNISKKNDLIKIIDRYRKKIAEIDCCDIADAIEIARDIYDKDKKYYAEIYVLETCKLQWIEKEFLLSMGCILNNVEDSEYLDYKKICSKIDNICFKKVYGDNAEVKEVIRTVINNQIPFDKVLVVALNSEPYTQLLCQQIAQYSVDGSSIPITFGSGISVIHSKPAKFILALLKWINSGYSIHDFISFIASDSVRLPSTEAEHNIRTIIINILKNAGITWQRETYLNSLEEYKNKLIRKQYQEWIDEVEVIINILATNIFPNIPIEDEDGKILVDDFVMGIKKIMKLYCNISNDIDDEGYEAIVKCLDRMIKDRKLTLSEISKRITETIDELRIHNTTPTAGKIHFTTVAGAEWCKREYTFLIGMDTIRFPSNINQNPILLDEERENGLLKSTDIIEGNIKNMSRFLESVTGKLYVSYSYFDTVQNRENYPSFIYNALIEGSAEKNNISADEFRKSKIEIINLNIKEIDRAIDENDYVLIKSGLLNKNNESRNSVESSISDIDISGINLEFSPSSLITYLGCRYKYYLKYILKLHGITDRELDKLGWLSHFEIGSLYHKIYELFINKVISNEVSLESEERAIEAIKEICQVVVKDYEQAMPTASEYHTVKEKENILSNCIKFVEDEIRLKTETKPLYTEYMFGKNKSCQLNINGESIFITGVVDRIDLNVATNTIKIIDYKTGSTYGYDILYSPNTPIINEKSIQPILYFLALKELTPKESFNAISEAEYRFVTEKGEYEKIKIDFTALNEEEIIEGLRNLISEIKCGNFSRNEKVSCKYCEYANSCRYKEGDN